MQANGFESNLTPAERIILSTFKYEELVWPVDCGLTESQIKSALNSLKQKDLIYNRAPYRLTKKGKRMQKLNFNGEN